MKIYTLIVISFFLSPFNLDNNLPDLLDSVNELLTDIETDKELIYQQMTYDEMAPFNVELIRTVEKIKDGKQKTESYTFNLALINEKNVAIKSSKNKMEVKLMTSGGKYIQKYEDGKSKGYTNSVELLCSDIDIARDIKSLLEEAIPDGKEDWETAIEVPDSIGDLKPWIEEYVTDVDTEKKSWIQSLSDHSEFQDYMIFSVQERGKENSNTYSFSWADIEAKSLKVNPSGDLIKLDIKTKSNKRVITRMSEDEKKFENRLNIYFKEAAPSFEFVKGVEKLIASSDIVSQERESSYVDCTDCIENLSNSVSDYVGKKWETTINNACESELTYRKVGKDDTESYIFSWSDMDISSLKQEYNSSELKLSVKTNNKEKFVTKMVNGEIKGYNDEIELLFNDLEIFRKAKHQVENAISGCELNLQPESLEWINQLVSSSTINEMNQSFTIDEDEACSIVFTSSKEDSDKSYAYDFNLYDIDLKRLNLKIRGSKLQLELTTNKNEKIITRTNQDGKLEYVNKLIVEVDNITNLRIARMTFERAVEECSN